MSDPLLRIAIPTPLYRSFDYLPPRGTDCAQLQPGMRVRVPFGRRHVIGVLLAVTTDSDVARTKLKPASAVIDRIPVIGDDVLAMVQWASDYYHCPIGEAMATAMPVMLRRGESPDAAAVTIWEQPLNIGALSKRELDIELGIKRLQGLGVSIKDLNLSLAGNAETLSVEPWEVMLDGTHFKGRLRLPWGERLEALTGNSFSILDLARRAELNLTARPLQGKLRLSRNLIGHTIDIDFTGFQAGVEPGRALQVDAMALIDNNPIRASLEAEPLAVLLRHPAGPWQNLALEMRNDTFRFEAIGGLERPLEGRGFDFRYALQGAEVNELLPVFNLILPIEGTYSLTGRFADQPDRLVFDKLKIKSGNNDICSRLAAASEIRCNRLISSSNSVTS